MTARRITALPVLVVAALLAFVSAGLLAGCGGSKHPAAKVVPARPLTAFASDQSALASLHGHALGALSTGTIIASNGFDPGRDGFSFENYGFVAGTEPERSQPPRDIARLTGGKSRRAWSPPDHDR